MDKYMLSGSCPKWQRHTVEIDLQFDEFKGVLRAHVNGNVLGASVLQSVLGDLEDGEYFPPDDDSRKHCIFNDEGELEELRLYDESGEDCAIDIGHHLEHCIVGVRIVDVQPEGRSK